MKRTLSFLITVIIIFSSLPISAIKVNASPFSGGDGSEANPYLVSTPEALDAVRENPKAYYLQTADIDMSSFGNWNPIPNFKGVYDGREQVISNLRIDTVDTSTYATSYGLFASAANGTVKNVILKDIDYKITKMESTEYVYGGADYSLYVGGISGEYGTIENCSVSGKITVNATSSYVGGICGWSHSEIKNCINSAALTVELSENSACGGIAGCNDGKINRSTNLGNISVNSEKSVSIGGICGINENGSIQNCLNSGALVCSTKYYYNSRSSYAGGIVGKSGNVKYSINYGSIKAEGVEAPYEENAYNGWVVGGIIGYFSEQYESGSDSCFNLARSISSSYSKKGSLTYLNTASRINGSVALGGMGNHTPSFGNCYSLDETLINEKKVTPPSKESMELKEQGKNLTAAECLLEASYNGFDFKNTWIIDTSLGGAMLRDIPYTPIPVEPETPQEVIAEFNDMIYRADHLSSGSMNILTDIATYNLLLSNYYSPSKIIIDAHPENMHTVAAAWEALKAAIDAADGKASSVLKQSAKQEDLITAYILSAVGAYTELEYADAVKKNFKHTENLVKIAVELNGTYAAGGEDFKSFITGKEGELDKLLADYYDKNDPTMSALLKTKKGISVISSVISKANDLEDLIAEISSYSKLYGMNEATKEALILMYEVCPEDAKEIKSSLRLAAEIINSANETMIDDIAKREFFFGLNKEAAYIATDKLWKYISGAFVDKCPVAKGFIELAKTQMTIVDKMFGIDARTEQYFKMCTLTEIDRIAGFAVNQALINYKDAPTSANASVFLAAIELKFNFIGQDYDEAIKYSEIITDSGMIQKMENAVRDIFGIDNVNRLKESLLKAERAMNSLHCTLLTSWISALDAEDHSIAQNYYEYRDRMYALYNPDEAESFIESFRNAAKQYSIHCPVNVKIFDASGTLVAEIGENALLVCDDIAVVYDHGEKDIYFFKTGNYKIVCEGFDTGDMDIEITDFDSDGSVIRTVNYNNVAVSDGSLHTLSGSTVSDGENTVLEADHDSASGAQKYRVVINGGMIEGYHLEYEAAPGERVEISAIIPEGYRFAGWQGDVEFEDAKAVSTYFFMTDSDVEISAKLKMIEDDDVEKDGIPTIVIFIIIGAAVITLSGIAILIVMIKEKSKKNSKENRHEADTL